MSLYAEYITERTADKIIEAEDGFVTYRFLNDGKTVYVIDVYVVPKSRGSGRASQLVNMVADIAKESGAIEMLGTVVPSANGSTISLKGLLAFGMKLQSSSNDLIIFRKDL